MLHFNLSTLQYPFYRLGGSRAGSFIRLVGWKRQNDLWPSRLQPRTTRQSWVSSLKKTRLSTWISLIWKMRLSSEFHYTGPVGRADYVPPNFGRSLNPISTKGERLCPPPRIFRPSWGPAIHNCHVISKEKSMARFFFSCHFQGHLDKVASSYACGPRFSGNKQEMPVSDTIFFIHT